MDIHKIVIPTPYTIGDVNAFLVKGDALSIFDVGPKTNEALAALKKGINEAGYGLKDIEQVVLTHHHPDHAGWIDAFPNATILGHEYVDLWIGKTKEFTDYMDHFYQFHLKKQNVPQIYIDKIIGIRKTDMEYIGETPLTKHINDGDEVPGHLGLKIYYTPGHAQSHLLFVHEPSNTAIGGDLLLEAVASNPLIEPPLDLSLKRPKTLLQYQDSLKLLKELHVSKVYTGHGNDVEQVDQLVTTRLERDQHRAKQVYDILSKPKTVIEVTKELYSTVYKTQIGLTLSKTQGHLDYLEQEDLVRYEEVNGVFVYSRS